MNALSTKNMIAGMETFDMPLDVKEITESGQIEGLASAFNNVDRGGDLVDPTAFDETMRTHSQNGTMPKMLWQHDPAQVIGIWKEWKVTNETSHRSSFMRRRT